MQHLPASVGSDVECGLTACVENAITYAGACRHRCTVVLAGEWRASVQKVGELLAALAYSDIAWHSDQVPEDSQDCYASAAFSLLGKEIDSLVFDAWSGFDPDAFGVLTGSIRAGGVLFLLTPPLANWAGYDDPQNRRIAVSPFVASDVGGSFLHRLVRLVRQDACSLLVEEGSVTRLPSAEHSRGITDPGTIPTDVACQTLDQQRAVEALVRVAKGHGRRPVVLVSDRGRGKSAAFGIAAARLLAQGKTRIVVTAPRRRAAETTLWHANDNLQGV